MFSPECLIYGIENKWFLIRIGIVIDVFKLNDKFSTHTFLFEKRLLMNNLNLRIIGILLGI